MLLAALLANVEVCAQRHFPPQLAQTVVTSITHNSQEAQPGSLFVAVRGFSDDGHKYLSQAEAQGACAAVVEEFVDCRLPQIMVRDSRRTLAVLAATFYGYPARKLRAIGITGTNGKTSTTKMIHHILGCQNSGLIGSVETCIGGRSFPSSITTPDALDIQRLLAQMAKARLPWVVMEVSSHGLKLQRVHGIQFLIAGITNITTDHSDLHPSHDDYVQTKKSLLSMLSAKGFALVNSDNPWTAQIMAPQGKTFRFGRSPQADFRFEPVANSLSSFYLRFSPEAQAYVGTIKPVRITLKIPGVHNIYNSTLAAAACLLAGCPLEQVKAGLETFPGVHRRLQMVFDGPYRVIDDYAHNPAGISHTLRTIRSMKPARLLVVTAVRGSRGESINQQNAARLAEELNAFSIPVQVWVTRSTHRVDPKDEVQEEEYQAFLNALGQGKFSYKEEPLLEKAITNALREASTGDILLLLGAQGMDQAQAILEEILAVKI